MNEGSPDPTPFPALQPLDAHNRRLMENVHPPDWANPAPKDRYHLVVIGAGTAGLVAASIASSLGARVALVERGLMGGDCLNTGCVPSKAVIRAANAWHAARTAWRFGGPAAAGDGDFGAAMERMRRVRAEISPADSARRFRDEIGADVFLGHARFVADDAIDVGGARLRFHRCVVATGGRAAVPPIPGLADAPYLTNETVFSLVERPAHLAVLGGGPIGCELAQAFARFGSRVTLLEAGARILPRDDADAAAVVGRALAEDGVAAVTGARVEAVEAAGEGMTIRWTRGGAADSVLASHLLVATGRTANVEGMGLDAAGIAHDRDGISVDARMRTSNPRVYAIGDVASRYRFTHAADAQARMVVRNALFFGRGTAESLLVPWVTYTAPEVAHVGIPPDEVERRGDEVRTITVPMADVDRARIDGATDGFVRVHLRAGSDRILGATIVSPHAGDIIPHVATAMTAGIGLGRLGETLFPYPTLAEALRKAADQWRRGKLTPLAKRAFGLFFRVR